MADAVLAWLWAFLFTQAVEVPVYMLGPRARWYEGFIASTLTHPIVWFVIPWLWTKACIAVNPAAGGDWALAANGGFWIYFAIAESFAVGVEAFYMRWLKKPHPFLWSLAANAASVALGLTSRALFGVP